MAWTGVIGSMAPILARAGAGAGRRRLPFPWRASLRTLAVLSLTLLAARYLLWRAGDTLNLSGPVAAALSLLTLVAEILLIGSGFLQLWFSLLPPAPMAARVERAAAALDRRLAASLPVPWVDVFVPSCGEPLPLLERCLRGCLAIDYPAKRVWLLDDSGRPELRQLCERLGCTYRARRDRLHAKAGNLNAALAHSDGELVAVFDADVVPLRSFLRRTVGLFEEGRVGFVQTPQHDMSANPVMRNLHLERWLMADEESFYRWVEPTRQSLGAVVCAGTSFVMRRRALERVGGFETGTSSEDLATGIRLAAAGYENLYLVEKLSAGLAPATVRAMARQRCRWASGTVQVLRTGASPLTLGGLNPLQRLGFLEGIAHWLAVLPQALLTAVIPLAISLSGVSPVRLDGAGLLQVALPFQLAQLLLVRWFSSQARAALMNELYRWIFLVPLSLALLATLAGRPQPFQVTAKSQGSGAAGGLDTRLALPLLLLLAVQLLAIGRALQAHGQGIGGFSTPVLLVILGWTGLTALLLLLALRACWQRPSLGGVPWFRLEQPLRLRAADGRSWAARLSAISEEGVEIVLEPGAHAGGSALPRPTTPQLGEALTLAVLPAAGQGPPLLELPWIPQLQIPPRRLRGRRMGGPWGELPEEPGSPPVLADGADEQLQAFLYRRPGLWPSLRAPLDLLAVPRALVRLLRRPRPESWFDRSLMPQSPAPAPGGAPPSSPPS